jgi:hypothetical protein
VEGLAVTRHCRPIVGQGRRGRIGMRRWVEREVFPSRDQQRDDGQPDIKRQGQGQYTLDQALGDQVLVNILSNPVDDQADGRARKTAATFGDAIDGNPALVATKKDQPYRRSVGQVRQQ